MTDKIQEELEKENEEKKCVICNRISVRGTGFKADLCPLHYGTFRGNASSINLNKVSQKIKKIKLKVRQETLAEVEKMIDESDDYVEVGCFKHELKSKLQELKR